jgi:hypothetical protein
LKKCWSLVGFVGELLSSIKGLTRRKDIMPVEHAYTVKAGTRSKLLFFHAVDLADPARGNTGLSARTPGAVAGYIREGQSQAQAVPLVPGRLGEWTAGGLAEVDPHLLPGVYQFGAPDEMLAEGSARVLLLIRLPGAAVRPIEVNLVAYDPQDAERIGLGGLSSGKRHEFLRQALPRFTEQELVLGRQAEQELRAKLAPGGGT